MKISTSIFLAASAATTVTAVAAENEYNTAPSECVDGLYLVMIRGTGEDPGLGKSGDIARNISERVKDSHIQALDYPATLADPIYTESLDDGVDALTSALQGYHKTCPDGKMGVMGYSQGGQVASYTFCGDLDGELKGNGLSSKIVDNVVAIVMFGDPAHVANATYDKGNSKKDGLFALDEVSVKRCEDLGSKVRSYCDTGDTYCDLGQVDDVHASYFRNYGEEVVDFFVDKFDESSSGSDSTSTKTTTTTTTAPTSTSTDESDASSTTEPSGSASESADADGASNWLQPFTGLMYTMPLVVVGMWEML